MSLLHQERAESETSTASEGVEDQEILETSALIGQFTNAVQNEFNNFLSDGVMTMSLVFSDIFLISDLLFWMEQFALSSGADFINYTWFQVNKYSTGYMFSSFSCAEEGVERSISTESSLIKLAIINISQHEIGILVVCSVASYK